jgi:MOSC domain-containing protein YiiM
MSELISVNVSAIKSVVIDGKSITTGIFKEPVSGRIALRGVNVGGDDQADRSVHGGPDRAAYVYAAEDYAWWEDELARALPPGTFGENLTVHGLDVSNARIGEEWQIGTALVQVTSPRVPCFKLAAKMNDPKIVKKFARALRPGAYLRIVTEGDIGAGDAITVVSRPAHDLTVATMANIVLFERARARELLVPEIPAHWRTWVEEQAP